MTTEEADNQKGEEEIMNAIFQDGNRYLAQYQLLSIIGLCEKGNISLAKIIVRRLVLAIHV